MVICRVCERTIVPAIKNHPEDKRISLETCPMCQRTLDAIAQQTADDNAQPWPKTA